MKCPHCEYEHGWSGEKLDVIYGKNGDFFVLSNDVQAVRPGGSVFSCLAEETRTVYACPSCRKVFIGE